jgi:molecular chaperone GrpE
VAKIPVKTVKDDENTVEEQLNEQEKDVQETTSSTAESVAEENGEQEVVQAEAEERSSHVDEVVPETGENTSETEAEPEIEEEDELTRLKKELEAKEQEAKEHYEARLRLQAEFDNFKKRKDRETLEFRKYANESFIKELLTVVDDFDRAIAAAEQTHKLEDFLKGVELIFDKLSGVLKKKGIKEIEAEGQPFNPEIHEAVTQIETDDVEEGMVVTVFQKGYYLHDRVILAPKVGVAKSK